MPSFIFLLSLIIARLAIAQITYVATPAELNQALSVAQPLTEVRITAGGTYNLDQEYPLPNGFTLSADEQIAVEIVAAQNSRHFNLILNSEIVQLIGFELTGGEGTPFGGSIFLDHAFLYCEDVQFRSNGQSETSQGGAIFAIDGNVTLSRTVFEGNSVVGQGGALYAKETSSFLFDCDFIGNSIVEGIPQEGGPWGGAIYAKYGDLQCYESFFFGNMILEGLAGAGGAMKLDFLDSQAILEDCRFEANAAAFGGALHGYYLEHGLAIRSSQVLYNRQSL